MKSIIVLIIFIASIFVIPASVQVLSPVKWSYSAKKISKDKAVIFVKATIDNGWHIYSTTQQEGGPVKTSFTFTPSKDYEVTEAVSESKPLTKYETAFAMNVSYFENSVIFSQKVKLNTPSATVKGSVKFMTCNDQKCLPPETIHFEIPIK